MLFQFKPMTDEEINKAQNDLLEEGVYSFSVKDIKQDISGSGNDMLKVWIKIVTSDQERIIIDYIVITPKMMFKFKHFCEAIGMTTQYKQGKFNLNDCIGRSGEVKLGVQRGNPRKDGSGYYPDKNVVKDYVKAEEIMKPDEKFNDDIKF